MHLTEPKTFPKPEPEILAVGGGKGGVGKTCFSVNLAIEIAKRGWRVLLADADLSCSNVEMVLGVQNQIRLDDFFYQSGAKRLTPVICETPYPNLRIIPGATGLLDVANPRYQKKMAFIRELRNLDADLVILDLDAGAHLNTLDFFLMTETNGILVITPEKTSIDNAFKFMRAVLFRKIERFYQSPEVGVLLKRNETLTGFLYSIEQSEELDDIMRRRTCGELAALARAVRPKIVVNKAANGYEAQIAAGILSKMLQRHLRIEAERLGYVCFDKCVQDAVNSGTPFVVGQPKQRISQCIADLASRLGYV